VAVTVCRTGPEFTQPPTLTVRSSIYVDYYDIVNLVLDVVFDNIWKKNEGMYA
jgi:hypothetical protein